MELDLLKRYMKYFIENHFNTISHKIKIFNEWGVWLDSELRMPFEEWKLKNR